MRVQSFKNCVRLSCSYTEFVQLRMALSARRSELKQALSGSEDPDVLDMTSFIWICVMICMMRCHSYEVGCMSFYR